MASDASDAPVALDARLLRRLVERHRELTRSAWADYLLGSWSQTLERFFKVVPEPENREPAAAAQDLETLQQRALAALGP